MNRATIGGYLGRDPELKELPSGSTVCELNVGVSAYDRRNKEKITQWYRASLWGQSAQRAAQMLRKGSFVIVTGDLVATIWESNNGPRLQLELSDCQLYLGPKTGGQQGHQGQPRGQEYGHQGQGYQGQPRGQHQHQGQGHYGQPPNPNGVDDDLPF